MKYPESSPVTWTDSYRVHSYHSDRFGKLRVNVIAAFLQESAWLHSNACGIGYRDLLEIGKMWILSGLKIAIKSYPVWGDNLTMNTWGNEYADPFAYRDFELIDDGGIQIIAGSTSWLLINADNHRPNRITAEYQKIPPRMHGSGSGKPERIPSFAPDGAEERRTANISDIDIYQHVNNAKYIEYCTDLIPIEFWDRKEIQTLTINYLSECLPGNLILFRTRWESENELFISAINESRGREVFRSVFSFRDRIPK
ncbi:MAG: hypothetical protein H6539_06245 [Bacteroidales bacterium]|nr:hypothetical protein [Bacteroidales bacterium]